VPTALLAAAAVTALVCAPSMGLVPATAPPWLALPLVMLVAGLWAALFPVIAHLSVAPDRDVGAGIGQLYLANVVGAVAGCLFTGFVLMDHLATRELTIALTVVGVAIAWVLWSDASAGPMLGRGGRPIRALRRAWRCRDPALCGSLSTTPLSPPGVR
jgi:hypothetical protein